MSTQYYDLRNPSNLPNSGRFIDPNSDQEFRPTRKETLTSFVSRIETYRQEKELPKFHENELRILAIMSLAETCDKKDLKEFFEPKFVTPDFSTAYSFAKVLLQQRFYFHQAGYDQRQRRAAACHGCKLHRTSSPSTSFVANIIKKIAGLGDLVQSESEKALGMCSACSCPMKSKVGFNIQGILAALTPEQIRSILLNLGDKAFEKCWLLSESLQDANLNKILDSKVRFSGERTKNSLVEYKKRRVQQAKEKQ